MGIISEYYRKSKESKKEEEEAAKKEYAASHPISAFYQSAASNSKLHTASAGESNKDFVARTLREDTNITNRLAERRTAEKNEAFKKSESNSEDANKRSVLNSAWREAASRGEVNTPVTPIPIPRLGESKYVTQSANINPAYRASTVIANQKRYEAATSKDSEEEKTVLPGITRPYTPIEKKIENYAGVLKLNAEVSALEDQYEAASKMLGASGIKKAEQIRSEIAAKKAQIESLRNERYNGLDSIAETERKDAESKKVTAGEAAKYLQQRGADAIAEWNNDLNARGTAMASAIKAGASNLRDNDFSDLPGLFAEAKNAYTDSLEKYRLEGVNERLNELTAKEYANAASNPILKVAGDTVAAVNNMLPSLAVSAGASTVLQAAGVAPKLAAKAAEIIGTGEMGLQTIPGSYAEARNDGATKSQAMAYSGAEVLNNAVGEMLIGDMIGRGTGLVGKAVNALTKGKAGNFASKAMNSLAKSPMSKTMFASLVNSAGEGAEEMVQDVVSMVNKKLTYDPNAKLDMKDVLYDGLIGLTMSGVMQMPNLPVSYMAYRSDYDTVNNLSLAAGYIMSEQEAAQFGKIGRGIIDDCNQILDDSKTENEDRQRALFVRDGVQQTLDLLESNKDDIIKSNAAVSEAIDFALNSPEDNLFANTVSIVKAVQQKGEAKDPVNAAIDFIRTEAETKQRIANFSEDKAEAKNARIDFAALGAVYNELRNDRKAIMAELSNNTVAANNQNVGEQTASADNASVVSSGAETTEKSPAPAVAETAQSPANAASASATLTEYLEDNGADSRMSTMQKARKLAQSEGGIYRAVLKLDSIAKSDAASAEEVKALKHEFAVMNAPTVSRTAERYNSVLSKNGIAVKVATEEQTRARDHGWYNAKEKAIYISPYMSNAAAIGATVVHEYTHRGADADMSLVNDILKVRDSAVAKGLYDARVSDEVDSAYAEDVRDMNDEQKTAYLNEEKAAHFLEYIMNDDKALREFVSEDRSLVRRIADAIADFVDRVFGRVDSAEARQARRTVEKLRGIVEETAQKVESTPDKSRAKTETETTSAPAAESPAETEAEPAVESIAESPETAESSAVKRDIRALVKGTGNAENAAAKLMDEYSGNADAAIADVIASDLGQSTKSQLVNAIAAESSNRQSGVSPDTAFEQDKAAAVRKSKELDFSIGLQDVKELQSIGNVSINQLDSNGIQKSRKWAEKFYREMGGKSPFFRAWYGDWREFDVNTTIVVEIPNISVGDVTLEYGDYHIADTGWDVHAGNDLRGDTRHHSGGKRVSYKSLVKIEEILENSILLDSIVSIPEKKKSPNTAFLHKLYTPVRHNGEIYLAKTTVEEFYNEATNGISRRAYNLKSIKIEPTGGLLGEANTSSPTEPMSGVDSNMSIADLFALVKANDKDFHYNPANRNMLNANGTPKVVYHGTTADFTTFEKGDIGYHVGSRTQAEDRISDVGGGHVMELYANIKNPLEIGMDYGDWHGKYAASMMLETEQFEGYDNESEITRRLEEISEMDEAEADKALPKLLKELGYDGIVYDNTFEGDSYSGDNYSYIVFDSNQLKSATDNIGTFDASNPDIRYSRELLSPEERAVRDAEDRAKRLEERNEYLRKQLTLTHTASGVAKVISPAKRRDIASSIATDIPGITIADADSQIKTVYDILEQPKRGAKDTAEVRYKEASEAAQKAAEWLVDNAYETQLNPLYDENRELRDFLRTTPIHLNESTNEWGDKESYQQWRAGNKGILRITPQTEINGTRVRGIDSIYSEAVSRFPEYFDADETDMHKMILRLGEVAEMLRENAKNEKVAVNPLADVRDSFVSQIANRIMWEYADKAELTKAAKQAYAQKMNDQDVRQARTEAQAGVFAAIDTAYQEGEAAGKKSQSAADDAYVMANEQRIALFEQTMKRDLEASRKQMQKEVDRANRKAQQIADKLVTKNSNQEIALNAKRFLTQTKRLYNRLTNPSKNTHVDDNLQAAVADALKSVSGVKFTDGSGMDGYQVERIANTATKGEKEDAAIRFIVDSYVDNLADAERAYHGLEAEILDTERYNKLTDDAKRQLKRKRDAALSTYYRTAGDMMALINDYVRKADEIFIDGKKQTAKDFADQLIADLELRHGVDEDKELRDMYDELKAMKESRGQAGIDDAQLDKDIQNQLDKIAKKKAENGWKATSNADKRSRARRIHYESCAPSTFFSMMGDTGTMMDRRIRAAQNKQAKLEQKYVDAIRKATNGKYSTWEAGGYGNHRVMIDLPGGVDSDYVKVDVSKAQLMSLYELWKRPAAQRHLEQQGACFLTVNGSQMQERIFAISEKTMEELISRLTEEKILTEEDIRVADAVQEFLATDCAEAGNEASMEMYNYKLFGDPNYFPIQVTDAVKLKNAPGFGADSRTFNLENSGFTKRIATNASGAIVIDDMFNVADKHVKQMAAYTAYAPVTNDLRRIMNDDRVKKAIEERMGKEANDYLDNFFNQLSNPLATGKDGVNSYWIFDVAGNMAKRSAVLWNVSTALKQPLSIFRAMSEINPKYIAEAYKSTAKNPLAFAKGGEGGGEYARIYNTMVENSGIAKMKMDGFSDTGFAKEMRNLYDDDFVNGGGGLRGMANANKVTRKILKGYDALSDAGAWMTGKGDEATWVQLWRACELESAEKYSDLSDAEQLKKTTEHFNEIIGRTQVVDSILDNAPLKGKLQNSVRGALGVFMNEPIKTYSNLLTAIDGVRNGRPGAKKQFAATAAASAVGSLIMEPLVSVMMSLIRNERDDRDGFGKQMLGKLFGIDVTDNGDGTSVISVASSEAVTSAVGFLNPYVGEIYELILDAVSGYSGEDMATQAINDFVNATTNLTNEEKAKYKTTARKMLDWADALSVLTGLGTKNIVRELRSIVWNTMSLSNSYEAQWEYLKLNYELGENTARQKKGYYDVLAKAYKAGDTEAYKRFRDELKGYGIDSDKIADEIDKRGGDIYSAKDGELYYIDLQSRWGIDGDPGNYTAEKIVSDVRGRSSDPAGFYYDAPKKYSKKDSDGKTVTMTEDEHLDFIDYSGKLARRLTIDLSKAKGWNDLTADQQVSACEKAWEYAKIAGRVRWVDTKDGVTYKFSKKWQETAYRNQQSGSEIAAVIIKNTNQYNKDDEADEEDEE